MAALTVQQVEACIHRRQRPRFVLALIFTLLLVPFVTLIGGLLLGYVVWLVFLFWVSTEVFYANFIGNSIMVSTMNYPRINELAEEIRATLSYDKHIDVFVYQQGDFNAFMTKFFFRRAVFLNSEILETGVSDDEVRWIIGRFVGYLRAQRRSGPAGWLIRMAQRFVIFNFFILPYDRAMVYTGDRLGLAAIGGDISTGISAMQKLLVGRQLGYSVNPIGLMEQHRRVKGSFFAFLARLGSAFPHTTARYVDLVTFAQREYPESYRRFEAANPGLPTDIARLSAEHGGVGPMLRAFFATLAVLIGLTVLSLGLEFVVFRLGGGVIGPLFELLRGPPAAEEPLNLPSPDNSLSTPDANAAAPDAAQPPGAGDAAAAAADNAAASAQPQPAPGDATQVPADGSTASPDANSSEATAPN